MLVLALRTDKPEAEVGLFEDDKQLEYKTWAAHRQLAESLHSVIYELLQKRGKDWPDIQGIICFEGPGSFTGLRIGLSVANALAYSLDVPIVAAGGHGWQAEALAALKDGQNQRQARPEYGRQPHITQPKK